MQFLSPSPPQFASVMPLPEDQSDASSSEKAAYTSSSESEDHHHQFSSSDSEDDVHRSGSDASSSTSSYATRRYSSASSDSVVSSALSFSSDTDDEHEPLDLETPLQPHYRSRHATTTSIRTSTTSRAITMQAIRNADTVGFVALLIPLTGIATMVVTETLACAYHFDCAKDYPTLSYAATFRPEGIAFMVGMCLTALCILVSSCLFYWFLSLRLMGGSAATADAPTRYTSLVCVVAGVATAVTLAGLAILDMRSYHDAHITFTVLFFISSWVLIVFCHLARRLLLLREQEHEAEKAGVMASSVWPALLGMDGGAGAWVSLKRWRRLSIPMAFTLGRLFILAGVTSTVLCTYTTWALFGMCVLIYL